jgi:hypothetical protein
MKEDTIEDVKISDLKADLELMKAEWQELVADDAEYNAKEDIFLATMANLEDELKGLKDSQKLELLDIRKKARVFADMQMLGGLLDQFSFEDEEGFDDEDEFEFEVEEDEDNK